MVQEGKSGLRLSHMVNDRLKTTHSHLERARVEFLETTRRAFRLCGLVTEIQAGIFI